MGKTKKSGANYEFRNIPETNRYGLVVPPSAEELEYLRLFQKPKKKPDTVERHHLYWPKQLYGETKLSQAFRDHPFNTIWILGTDHKNMHNRFDGVPKPHRDVMLTYLDEAKLLGDLGVQMRGVEMIDEELYMGRVKHIEQAERHKQEKLDIINGTLDQVDSFKIMSTDLAWRALQQLADLSRAA